MAEMMPFIDLAAQRALIREELDAAIEKVVNEGRYILGPEVTELQHQIAEYCGAPFALGCANGTDALALPLMAWGLRPGDAIFVPSFTFASTAEVVRWLGATPIFVDVDEATYTMDVEHLKACMEMVAVDDRLTARAVIAVDLFGQPANYPEIRALCDEYGLHLIADSAQGFGCTLDDKHPIHWADIATISFYPAKPLGGYGDGGAMVMKDEALHGVLKSLHIHGAGDHRYEYARIGMNSRLDTMQAAILLQKLKVFPDEIVKRNEAADAYNAALSGIVKTPKVITRGVSTWAQYTIEVDDRDGFQATMREHGVPTAVYYPWPLHDQPAYRDFSPTSPGGLPVTEAISRRVVSLPMDGYMTSDRIDRVIGAVKLATRVPVG